MKVYHETSFDNYYGYIRNYVIPLRKNWDQSNDNHMYFYGNKDDNTMEDAYYSTIKCTAIHASQ